MTSNKSTKPVWLKLQNLKVNLHIIAEYWITVSNNTEYNSIRLYTLTHNEGQISRSIQYVLSPFISHLLLFHSMPCYNT